MYIPTCTYNYYTWMCSHYLYLLLHVHTCIIIIHVYTRIHSHTHTHTLSYTHTQNTYPGVDWTPVSTTAFDNQTTCCLQSEPTYPTALHVSPPLLTPPPPPPTPPPSLWGCVWVVSVCPWDVTWCWTTRRLVTSVECGVGTGVRVHGYRTCTQFPPTRVGLSTRQLLNI